MADIRWYANRLKAMGAGEILWRFSQKRIQAAERRRFKNKNIPVIDEIFYGKWEELAFHGEKLGIPDGKQQVFRKKALETGIILLGGYAYTDYKKDWHAGFLTDQKWPLEFSYDLSYKQRDDIGDARINWELNRHFQFALLSKDYYLTGNNAYLTELSGLFYDWNQRNPFLTGISWTSVMETAIRTINWIYALGFLEAEEHRCLPAGTNGLKEAMRIGIINMTAYIADHYSRYSSANNHVIVEAAALGLAGIVLDCPAWSSMAQEILNREIPRQNCADGVNKEMSLHYQSFFLEAVGLLILTMQENKRPVPGEWQEILMKMSRYLSDCRGSFGETIVFGDDDAGKILDLSGRERDYYAYVLQLMSLVLPERYAQEITDETLLCLTEEAGREGINKKPYYHMAESVCYEEGGVSLLKSLDGKALIGIDHGELGFGSIAAHGHADALSFQMFLEGEAVFADAGTYIYHVNLPQRNDFRRTENHNTLTVNGVDQSEMLGAFLWGKRAETELAGHNLRRGGKISHPAGQESEEVRSRLSEEAPGPGQLMEESLQMVEAFHNGYAPVLHRRQFSFDKKKRLIILDRLEHIGKETDWALTFLLGSHVEVLEDKSGEGKWTLLCGAWEIRLMTEGAFAAGETMDAFLSYEYGRKEASKRLRISGKCRNDLEIRTVIEWEKV